MFDVDLKKMLIIYYVCYVCGFLKIIFFLKQHVTGDAAKMLKN